SSNNRNNRNNRISNNRKTSSSNHKIVNRKANPGAARIKKRTSKTASLKRRTIPSDLSNNRAANLHLPRPLLRAGKDKIRTNQVKANNRLRVPATTEERCLRHHLLRETVKGRRKIQHGLLRQQNRRRKNTRTK